MNIKRRVKGRPMITIRCVQYKMHTDDDNNFSNKVSKEHELKIANMFYVYKYKIYVLK